MKIFIGWDSKQAIASHVCEYSLRKHAHGDLEIIHLDTQALKDSGVYFRPDGSPASTEFAYSRFLVPYLCDYEGYAMFVDSDFLFTYNINILFRRVLDYEEFFQRSSVHVCKHQDYVPNSDTKFYGQPQEAFPKKNWSSLMIFNNEHEDCKKLHPMSVANRSPQWLHRFHWTDEKNIKHIPYMWNWLVGEYADGEPVPFGIHFTNGGPFNGVWGQDYEDIWLKYRDEMKSNSPS